MRPRDVSQALEYTGGQTQKAAALIMDAHLQRTRQKRWMKRQAGAQYGDNSDDSSSEIQSSGSSDACDLGDVSPSAPVVNVSQRLSAREQGCIMSMPPEPTALASATEPGFSRAFKVPTEPVPNRIHHTHVQTHSLPGASSRSEAGAAELAVLKSSAARSLEVSLGGPSDRRQRRHSYSQQGSGARLSSIEARRARSKESIPGDTWSLSTGVSYSTTRQRRNSRTRASSSDALNLTSVTPVASRTGRKSSKTPSGQASTPAKAARFGGA